MLDSNDLEQLKEGDILEYQASEGGTDSWSGFQFAFTHFASVTNIAGVALDNPEPFAHGCLSGAEVIFRYKDVIRVGKGEPPDAQEGRVIKKIKKLWNKPNYVAKHPEQGYDYVK